MYLYYNNQEILNLLNYIVMNCIGVAKMLVKRLLYFLFSILFYTKALFKETSDKDIVGSRKYLVSEN